MTPFPIDSRKPDSPFLERLRNGVTRCHPSPAEPTRGAKVEGAIVCSRARTRTRGSEAIRSHHRPLRRRALPGSRRRSPLSSACPSVDQVRPAAPPPHGEGGGGPAPTGCPPCLRSTHTPAPLFKHRVDKMSGGQKSICPQKAAGGTSPRGGFGHLGVAPFILPQIPGNLRGILRRRRAPVPPGNFSCALKRQRRRLRASQGQLPAEPRSVSGRLPDTPYLGVTPAPPHLAHLPPAHPPTNSRCREHQGGHRTAGQRSSGSIRGGERGHTRDSAH